MLPIPSLLDPGQYYFGLLTCLFPFMLFGQLSCNNLCEKLGILPVYLELFWDDVVCFLNNASTIERFNCFMHYLRLGIAKSVILQSTDSAQNNALLHANLSYLESILGCFSLSMTLNIVLCRVGIASLCFLVGNQKSICFCRIELLIVEVNYEDLIFRTSFKQ